MADGVCVCMPEQSEGNKTEKKLSNVWLNQCNLRILKAIIIENCTALTRLRKKNKQTKRIETKILFDKTNSTETLFQRNVHTYWFAREMHALSSLSLAYPL